MTKKRKHKASSTTETEDSLEIEDHGDRPTPKKKKTTSDREIEHAILKNLVELQKVQTDLSEKFAHLATEISHLLALFEVTARNFAKNIPANDQFTKDKEFLDKIDKLLDQNKTLAKGLTLMEERLRERLYSAPAKMTPEKKPEEEFTPSMTTRSRPLPRF
jgi:septal ring factor EnvC (AmiA/AmiB activator)